METTHKEEPIFDRDPALCDMSGPKFNWRFRPNKKERDDGRYRIFIYICALSMGRPMEPFNTPSHPLIRMLSFASCLVIIYCLLFLFLVPPKAGIDSPGTAHAAVQK